MRNARIEHDRALERAIVGTLSDHTELGKRPMNDPEFSRWLSDHVSEAACQAQAA